MFCNHCGTELPDNSSFCTKCGMAVGAKKPVQARTQPEAANKAPRTTPSSDAIGARKSKTVLIWSGIIAVVLQIIGLVSGVTFFTILGIMALLVAMISFYMFVMHTKDIPDEEKTQGQKAFLSALHIIWILAVLLVVGIIVISFCVSQNVS